MEPRRLTRSETDRMIAGVCGGTAAYLGIDPTLVRLGFIAASMVGGVGVVLYLAMWLIVPRGSQVDAAPREVVKDNVAEGRRFAEETARAAKDAFEQLRGSRSEEDGPPPTPPTAGTPPDDEPRDDEPPPPPSPSPPTS